MAAAKKFQATIGARAFRRSAPTRSAAEMFARSVGLEMSDSEAKQRRGTRRTEVRTARAFASNRGDDDSHAGNELD